MATNKGNQGATFMRFMMAVAFALLASAPAAASCVEAWPPDMMKTRPGFTCVPLTDHLLASLQGATKAEVTKAMKANGRPVEIGLHFNSVADRYSGDVNLKFEGDRVVAVTALVDGGDQLMSFTWNPEYDGTERSPCSDLPGSHYAKCE
jgi:hypothetical protein